MWFGGCVQRLHWNLLPTEIPDDGSSICSRNELFSCDIGGSQGGVDEGNRVPGYDAVKSDKYVPKLHSKMLPPSSGKSYHDGGSKIHFKIITGRKTSGIFRNVKQKFCVH